ncbi:hypothetical protein COO60DRAFT_1522113 [Scenedesmus sp. NREL 46B-D3]|nr:hypothetical protein COO60DRAFT_1522113 [Scenedesmus sp. NREL 46B-D3]
MGWERRALAGTSVVADGRCRIAAVSVGWPALLPLLVHARVCAACFVLYCCYVQGFLQIATAWWLRRLVAGLSVARSAAVLRLLQCACYQHACGLCCLVLELHLSAPLEHSCIMECHQAVPCLLFGCLLHSGIVCAPRLCLGPVTLAGPVTVQGWCRRVQKLQLSGA